MVEGVPAWVCRETGETRFSPETADPLPALIHGHLRPVRVIETPVYQFGRAKAAA